MQVVSIRQNNENRICITTCDLLRNGSTNDEKEKNQEVVKNQGGLGRLAPTCNKDAHLLRKRLGTSAAAHHYLTQYTLSLHIHIYPSLYLS